MFGVDLESGIQIGTYFLDKNEKISYNEVIKQLQKRDQRDKERSVAPLVAAKDAHHIDTTGINIELITVLATAFTLEVAIATTWLIKNNLTILPRRIRIITSSDVITEHL